LAKEQPGTIYTKAGGFLDSLEEFDADFFGIGPREASRIDPQHRILLEVAWDAIEDAGQSPDALAGQPVGVFVGISSNEYITLQYDDPGTVNPYTNSGGAFCMAANRLSYMFGFRGASMSIDTACSSSLVAIHQACLSLWAGESTLALAGGANALVKPAVSIGLCQAAMLSPSGRCRSFDAAANGYVRGEGCGLFLLKPLDRAEADRDPIHAVIRGSAVNSDGRTQGISLPSMEAQESLLREVYTSTGIDPSSVCYVEAHGTGTPAGDPIECAALGHVLGRTRAHGAPCYIGSVKSNLGHLEPASGAAGLAKVLVCLAHGRVPANLHFENPNPAIPFDELGLKVVAEDLDLPRSPEPLRIGLNSFGFGGTNAHLIVEEYRAPKADPLPAGAPRVPLCISARSEQALRDLAGAYRDLLIAPEGPGLGDVVQAAAARRGHHQYRLAVHGESNAEVAGRLDAWRKSRALNWRSSSPATARSTGPWRGSCSKPMRASRMQSPGSTPRSSPSPVGPSPKSCCATKHRAGWRKPRSRSPRFSLFRSH
jgi:acyl transferase domain-containing protein